MIKYNNKTCLHLKFTNQGLDNLNHLYHAINKAPTFITDFIQMRPSKHMETIMIQPGLYEFNDDGRFLLMPNPVYTDYKQLMISPTSARKNEAGFALIGWFIHPSQLLETTYRNKKNKLSVSPNLITILDLTEQDIPFLEDMEKIAKKNLIANYHISDNDVIRMYFHFPYTDIETSLHLHITVNQGMHNLEKSRSVTLAEVLQSIKTYGSVKPLIHTLGTIQISNNPHSLDFLSGIDGLTLSVDANPHIQSNSIEVFL